MNKKIKKFFGYEDLNMTKQEARKYLLYVSIWTAVFIWLMWISL
jgi:hypothetical protein